MKAVRWIYNGSVILGVGLSAIGAGLIGGAGVGLLTAGSLVLAFTVYGAERMARGRG